MKSLPVKYISNGRMSMVASIFIILFLAPALTEAGSFRCGTKIVITGDPITRLLETCGQPSMKYKAKETVLSNGKRQATGVTNWVYARGHKKNMVVSVRSGKVVRIALE